MALVWSQAPSSSSTGRWGTLATSAGLRIPRYFLKLTIAWKECVSTRCGLRLHMCCVFCSWNLCGATWPWDHGSKKKSQCPFCSRVRSVWWAWRLWRPCWRAPTRLTGAWHTAGCSLGLECGVALWWCQVLSRNPPIAANHWWVNFKPQYHNVFKYCHIKV